MLLEFPSRVTNFIIYGLSPQSAFALGTLYLTIAALSLFNQLLISCHKRILMYALTNFWKRMIPDGNIVIGDGCLLLKGRIRLIYLSMDTVLHLVHLSLLGLLMFSAMSFNATALLAVVLGNCVGYYLSGQRIFKSNWSAAFKEADSDCEALHELENIFVTSSSADGSFQGIGNVNDDLL